MAIPARDRLAFTLPDFTRVLWVSDGARDVWAPRVEAITRAWLETEWRTIVHGVRALAVTMVAPEALARRSELWQEHGLVGFPVESHAASLRVVVGSSDAVRAFQRATEANDDTAIGRLLGHPSCCTEFFRRVWVGDGMMDTTWPMALASAGPQHDGRALTVSGAAEANILWRWVGLRGVPHLPCGFDCPDTVALGRQCLDVGRRAGFSEEMAWLEEILSWPVEWSALHGIAKIRTPILKVATSTDATAVAYVVRRRGESYPLEGARGQRFPYEVSSRPALRRPGREQQSDRPQEVMS